ncbi:hypothetical protein LDENG_00074420 [Lucifuga dentata]|nr:hypothetical protein LDENG_00074420 [Lucifuga dentata]
MEQIQQALRPLYKKVFPHPTLPPRSDTEMASTSTIAKGCFGKVYKEKYNDTWAAIKKVPHQLISRKDLERESKVYNKVKHPNIVKLLGDITLTDGKWIIPLEFIFGEDLETTIFKASKSKIQLTPANRGKIIVGMCEGLLTLHLSDIVHQDLKPENIMVEHGTNRAVIIDLGLAKFFRRGLNSAMDMGNEAYSSPEVLRIGSQRDQRSDVWAMGKIIAELCARIRLYTPSVCPEKIKETLRDQPFCRVVCRMVQSDPALRATMAGVIGEIRSIGNGSGVTTAPVKKDLLQPPSTNINVRNQSPSPMNRGITALYPQTALHQLQEDKDKDKTQALVPAGTAGLTGDFVKMMLYQEASKDLPCNLPATGRVVVRRFEEKNGEVETWEQKEVVTKDGKIVKFDDITFNSK